MKKCLKCRKALLDGFSFYGLHGGCYREWFQDPDLKGFKGWDLKNSGASPFSAESPGETGRRGALPARSTFYHGRYRKYGAQIGQAKYILKVQEEKFPSLPETEYICSRIAAFLALKPAAHFLIRLPAGRPDESGPRQDEPEAAGGKAAEGKSRPAGASSKKAFVTRNFMQGIAGELHHIYKFLPKGDQSCSCKNIIQEICRQTGRPEDGQKLAEICLFDSLIGNNDRHGRNLALIDTGKKKELAPIYDNPSFLGTEGEDLLEADFNVSGSIRTSLSKDPKITDYAAEFKRLGLEESCRRFIKKAARALPEITREVEISELSQKRKRAFVKYISKQLKALERAFSRTAG